MTLYKIAIPPPPPQRKIHNSEGIDLDEILMQMSEFFKQFWRGQVTQVHVNNNTRFWLSEGFNQV